MHYELIFAALFSIATGVAIFARWLRVPYTVALVVAGLAFGATRAIRRGTLREHAGQMVLSAIDAELVSLESQEREALPDPITPRPAE